MEHMSDIDPQIQYARVIHTNGHHWKLYEIHRSHVKKTKFFRPRTQLRASSNKRVMFTAEARFFDDYEHMLSVIGMLRFAMGIQENIVQSSEVYEIEELPIERDPQRTIQRSLLSQHGTGTHKIQGVDVKFITSKHESVVSGVRHDRIKVDGPDSQPERLTEGKTAAEGETET